MLKYFDEMEQKQIPPSDLTFRFIVEGFAKKSDTESMEKYYSVMKERNIKQTNAFSLSPFVFTYAKKNNLDDAMKYLIQMENARQPITKEALEAVIELLLHAQEIDTVITVLNKTERLKMQPADYSYNAVIDKFLSKVRAIDTYGKNYQLLY